MIKVHIFGSCSGTEPFPGRHHTAFAVEAEGRLYWFDAGEGCSYTAHSMGLDLLSVREIFLSHPHVDHTGGLCNLLWTVRKLNTVQGRMPAGGGIEVVTPSLSVVQSALGVLAEGEKSLRCKFPITVRQLQEGLIFDDGILSVEAIHNLHLPRGEDGSWRSFSFRIRTDGKTVLFSGDVRSVDELEGFLADGCSLFLMETGHHDPTEIAAYLTAHPAYSVGKLVFLHHGRCFLNQCEEKTEEVRRQYAGDFAVAYDGMTLTLA